MITDWQEQKRRPKYRGLHISAIDGDRLTLPLSEEILDEGYRGTPCPGDAETYYPVLYYSCMVDVITGTPVGFLGSVDNDEITAAYCLVQKNMHKNSLGIFDRFYLCNNFLSLYADKEHEHGFFIVRCKTGSTFKEVIDFAASKKDEITTEISGVRLRLIRYKPKDEKEDIILATNLPKSFKSYEIAQLYSCRWEAETGNRDRTSSIKIEQFRSKSTNGIFQEIYASLIIQALARIVTSLETKPELSFMMQAYSKSNLKAVMSKMIDCLGRIVILKSHKVIEGIVKFIKKTVEKRKRFTRNYDRKTKFSVGNLYKHESVISRRD